MGTTTARFTAVGIAVAPTFGLGACSGEDADTPAAGVVVDETESGSVDGQDVQTKDGNLFISEEDGFEIGFPGDPDVNQWEEEESGKTYTGTGYFYEDEDGSYAVSVSRVPLDEGEQLDGRAGANVAASSVVDSTGGTEVSVSTDETFLGRPSASVYLKVDRNGTVKDLFSRVVVEGENVFQIFTIGLDQDKFDKFESSFAFID